MITVIIFQRDFKRRGLYKTLPMLIIKVIHILNNNEQKGNLNKKMERNVKKYTHQYKQI